MSVIEYNGSTDPRALRNRISRKNTKEELVRRLSHIYSIMYREDRDPENQLEAIEHEMHMVIF